MIISKEEFLEMGFEIDDKHSVLLENCIKRAGFVLDGITNGRASSVAAGSGAAADYVKQAAAFQANDILKEEIALAKAEAESASSGDSSSSKSEERVSIGDFSYSTGTSSSKSTKSSSSSKSESSAVKILDTDGAVMRLLRAAGCFYGGTPTTE